jgi:hypothetical protein
MVLPRRLAMDEGLELLNPVEDRLDTHPGALLGPMKPGNSVLVGGSHWMRSFFSRRLLFGSSTHRFSQKARKEVSDQETIV